MARYLADTSAWNRGGRPDVAGRWRRLLADDDIATCPPVRLELLYSARGKQEYARLSDALRGLPELSLGTQAVDAAERVQAALADRAQHRDPRPIDLLIAGIAQVADATLLHYDRHFDAIARVTSQPMEWIAPRGTLD
jgi:predicted nucleic acid-binding protein